MWGHLVAQLLVLGDLQERIIALEAAGHEAAPGLDRVASFVDWGIHVPWVALASQLEEMKVSVQVEGKEETNRRKEMKERVLE